MSSRANQKGFTLTEALIATAIFAGVVVATAPTMQTAMQTSARASTTAAVAEDLRTTERVIRARLARAVDLGSQFSSLHFRYGPSEISFAFIDADTGDINQALITIVREQHSAHVVMIIRDPSNARAVPARAVLLRNVVNGEFAFGFEEALEVLALSSEDAPRQERPVLVTLSGAIEDRGLETPFQFTFHVGGGAPVFCAVETVSGVCRGSGA